MGSKAHLRIEGSIARNSSPNNANTRTSTRFLRRPRLLAVPSTGCGGQGLVNLGQQRGQVSAVDFAPPPAPQTGRQRERAESNPHEPTDRGPQFLEHAPHFAVTAFAQHDPVPAIRPVPPATECGRISPGRRRASRRGRADRAVGRELAANAHRVFALDLAARVHEAVGEIPGIGEKKQTPVLKSSRPTAIQSALPGAGSFSNTVGRPPGSRAVTSSPAACDRSAGAARAPAIAASGAPSTRDPVRRPNTQPQRRAPPVDRQRPGRYHAPCRGATEARARQHLVQLLVPARRARTLLSGGLLAGGGSSGAGCAAAVYRRGVRSRVLAISSSGGSSCSERRPRSSRKAWWWRTTPDARASRGGRRRRSSRASSSALMTLRRHRPRRECPRCRRASPAGGTR